MTGQLPITHSKNLSSRLIHFVIAGYIILAVISLKNYLSFQSVNFILGLIALPFALQINHQKRRSCRFAWMLLLFVILCYLMPVSTLLYFTICFALLFLVEYFFGRINLAAVLTLALMAPVFQYFIDSFSFPLRLQLTSFAGTLFNLFGSATTVKGNVIIYQENEFSVDPGCMGLKMMETSLMLAVMLTGFYQNRFQRRLPNGKLLLYLGVIISLNILANLIRIVLLIQFSFLPGTFSHELVGIICLIVYVFLPAAWLATVFVKRSPLWKNPTIPFPPVSRMAIFLQLGILSIISLLSMRVSDSNTYKAPNLALLNQENDFLVTAYAPGILKLENNKALTYIKYVRGFYDTDHNPMVCWKGSGYVFDQIQREKIANREVYTGLLINGTEKLYSAWWYGNADFSSVSQFEWRWEMLKGKKNCAVVNVTCAERKELERQVSYMFREKTLNRFFDQEK